MLEPTKKDILHPKTKKKPHQDSRRGTNAIKSNPKPIGWVTHSLENNYTTEVLPQGNSESHIRILAWGSINGRKCPQRICL